ncbi:DUF2125 domain-containing protein [Devosia sp.]|uniref:DUF2125 domain-containing protein n=1 Tax=Devosia sp. TaxID=1871048 RepID=UPI002AFFDF10|nr:DUF2125 domain-containing protein [Devosia sp.]
MKKRIIILGAIVLAAILGWSAYWLVAAGMVQREIETMAEADGVTMPILRCEGLAVRGYPFRFDVDCPNAEIVSGDIGVTLPGLRASVRAYALNHVLISAKGPALISDSFTGTRNSLGWKTLEASLRLDNWRLARASVVGEEMVWSDSLFGETLIAQAPRVELHAFDMPEIHDAARFFAGAAIYGRLDGLDWPGLSLADGRAEIQLEVTGLPDDVRNWGDPMLLPAMQQAGGGLKIVSIHASTADMVLDAEGQMQLDPQGRVNGQVDIRSTGVAERIGPLLEEPVRTLVLGLPGEDGAYANQINFRAGTVFSGLVPLANLPPLF